MKNEIKKNYKSPKLEIIKIKKDDIIVTSGTPGSFNSGLLGGGGYKL